MSEPPDDAPAAIHVQDLRADEDSRRTALFHFMGSLQVKSGTSARVSEGDTSMTVVRFKPSAIVEANEEVTPIPPEQQTLMIELLHAMAAIKTSPGIRTGITYDQHGTVMTVVFHRPEEEEESD